MIAAANIAYLFDPLCGWCYGASATLEKLMARPEFNVSLVPTGLFAGEGARPMDDGFAAYAWTNDQRIARLTGQVFSEDYRHNVLGDRTRLFDSGPATLALTAVALTAPHREFEALKATQSARYVEGRDTTDVLALSQVLHALNLPEAADRLATSNGELRAAYRQRLAAVRAELRQFGEGGAPALIVGVGEHRRIVRASALFGNMDVLLEGTKDARAFWPRRDRSISLVISIARPPK